MSNEDDEKKLEEALRRTEAMPAVETAPGVEMREGEVVPVSSEVEIQTGVAVPTGRWVGRPDVAGAELKQPGEAAEPDKQPLERWAEAAGMLPQFDRSVPPRANPEYWRFAAAKAFKGWHDGELVTESEFQEAVAESQKQTSR